MHLEGARYGRGARVKYENEPVKNIIISDFVHDRWVLRSAYVCSEDGNLTLAKFIGRGKCEI